MTRVAERLHAEMARLGYAPPQIPQPGVAVPACPTGGSSTATQPPLPMAGLPAPSSATDMAPARRLAPLEPPSRDPDDRRTPTEAAILRLLRAAGSGALVPGKRGLSMAFIADHIGQPWGWTWDKLAEMRRRREVKVVGAEEVGGRRLLLFGVGPAGRCD